jgi:N-acetylmuramoyl-L-alanine amidase
LAAAESGAIGAASIAARTVTLPTAQSLSAKLRDR